MDSKLIENKMVKEIKVNLDKCVGCRACEVVCSAFHAVPKYSSTNPARSRIRVFKDELNDEYVPIRACGYIRAECTGRRTYTINEKEYRECSFCGVSCSVRGFFKEPDSGLPLKCDMCEADPPLSEPLCVQACGSAALIYEEREVDVEEQVEEGSLEKMKIGLDALANQYGLDKIMATIARMSISKNG